MARRGALVFGNITPFGQRSVDFSAFNIVNTSQEAYLELVKVQIAWENGQATDAEMRAALVRYANTLTPNTSERLNAEQRVKEFDYRIERSILQRQIEDGEKTLYDLLEFDARALEGMSPDSQAYRDRLNTLENTQVAVFREAEQAVVDRYQAGQMTTAALRAWYEARLDDPLFSQNPDLVRQIQDRITTLKEREVAEQDARVISDFNAGRIGVDAFLAYATSALARYAPGTEQAIAWQERIDQARDQSIEQDLLYRYGLSQEYLQLAQFVATNSQPPQSSSTSKRVVLGPDGHWVTVEKASITTLTPAQQEAWRQRQIEVAEAKKRMNDIAAKIGSLGGWVTTDQMLTFYQGQLSRYAKGSDEWYSVQRRIDDLLDRKRQETVLRRQGVVISFGGGGGGGESRSATRMTSGGSASDVDTFLKALARVESGGRYDARNSKTGAFGKYQILPSNWPAWAKQYLGDANAPMTPENQEKVARAKALDLFKWLGSWEAVAHWWLTGGASKEMHQNPALWSADAIRYVNNVMSGMGRPAVSGQPLTGVTPVTRPKVEEGKGGAPIQIVTNVGFLHRTAEPTVETTPGRFPTFMDGEAFRKFYAAWESAFESGSESFTVNYGSGPVTFWIGDDALTRAEMMAQIDEMNIELFAERQRAYEGTPSEITASEQYNQAVKNAAKHAYDILRTVDTSYMSPDRAVNPIGAGLRLLTKTRDAIRQEIDYAKRALARGDVTVAYLHLQQAQSFVAAKDQTLAAYAAAAKKEISRIESTYGISVRDAYGASSETFTKDLDTLLNWDDELNKELQAGDPIWNQLRGTPENDYRDGILKLDPYGNVVTSGRPGGDFKVLVDDSKGFFRANENGTVTWVSRPATGFDSSGKRRTDVEGMVPVQVKSGTSVILAYAPYKVVQVGTIDINGVKYPLLGKAVIYGGQQWVEDPFKPGHWSTSPVKYVAPKTLQVKPGTRSGEYVYVLRSGADTYLITTDPQTGLVRLVFQRNPLLGPPETQDFGDATNVDVARQLTDLGFTRDLSGLAGDDLFFSDVIGAKLGFTASEYRQFLENSVETPKRIGRQEQLQIEYPQTPPVPQLTWTQQLQRVGEEPPKFVGRQEHLQIEYPETAAPPALPWEQQLKRVGESLPPITPPFQTAASTTPQPEPLTPTITWEQQLKRVGEPTPTSTPTPTKPKPKKKEAAAPVSPTASKML